MADKEKRSVVVWLGSSKDVSCSGIILDFERGIVLTTGSLFREFLSSKLAEEDKSVLYPVAEPTFSFSERKVNEHEEKILVKVLVKTCYLPKYENISVQNTLFQGRLALLWRDNDLLKLLHKIFPMSEWDFGLGEYSEIESKKLKEKAVTGMTDNSKSEMLQSSESYVPSIFLSTFALLQVPNLTNINANSDQYCSVANSFSSLLNSLVHLPSYQVGDLIRIIGTPFGFECPSVFFNSVSKGIISNLAGSNSQLILTDARAIPGCEGCPLFLEKSEPYNDLTLLGIVLAPFCWRNGEWIGITVACTIKQVLKSLCTAIIQENFEGDQELFTYLHQKISDMYQHFSADQFKGSINPTLNKQMTLSSQLHSNFDENLSGKHLITVKELHKLLQLVVLVKAGRSWGTGVVLSPDEGLLLSCSHVVRGATAQNVSLNKCSAEKYTANSINKTCTIRTGAPDFAWYEAKVLFATSPESAIDLAILKFERKTSLLQYQKAESNPDTTINSLHSSVSQCNFQKSNIPKKGDSVVVVGYAMFGGELEMGPSVTAGVLSNIVYSEGQAVMLQTTAAVHSGASGGAIFSTQTGNILGLVTCNTKDANTSASFPHINFAVPVNLLQQFLNKVEQSSEAQSVEVLIPKGTHEIWSLKKMPCSSHL